MSENDKLIWDKDADYCLALKGNHQYLHERVIQLFEQAEAIDWSGVKHDFHRTISKGHGRTEIRRYWTMPVTELLFDPDQWVGLQSIGLVESVRKTESQTTIAKRYYLNSFDSDAQLLANAVRSHWGVEKRCDPAEVSSAWERAPRDRLHWVLDVAFSDFHKGENIREIVEEAGCELWYLPTYSPDLNKIENWWAVLKTGMKQRLIEFNTVRDCVDTVFKECPNVFA